MSAVLKELHTLLPSCGNTFFWCDEHCELSNLYDDPFAAPELAALYLQEFYNRPERELHRGFSYAMRHYRGVVRFSHTLSVDLKTYLNSEFYNLIMRPSGYADGLHLIVHAGGGRPLGDLAVWRALDEVNFNEGDKHLLEDLAPFIAHAVASDDAGPALTEMLVDAQEDRALVIVDRAGKIQHLSPKARKLLFLANNPYVTAGHSRRESLQLPPQAIQLCSDLCAVIERGQDVVAPPVYQHESPWGRFVFTAHWLDCGNALDSLIGITIDHQVPLPLKVSSQVEHFPLSERQKQICLLLAAGHVDSKIADEMNISINTVVTHCRRIYDKLHVHGRAELMNRLLQGRHQFN